MDVKKFTKTIIALIAVMMISMTAKQANATNYLILDLNTIAEYDSVLYCLNSYDSVMLIANGGNGGSNTWELTSFYPYTFDTVLNNYNDTLILPMNIYGVVHNINSISGSKYFSICPLVLYVAETTTISCSDSANLYASTNYYGAGSVTYSWSPLTGLNNPNVAEPVANPNSSTNYTVTAFINGCVLIDSVRVNVNPLIVNANDISTTCGTPAILNTTNNYTGSDTLTYNWQPINGLNASNISNPTASISSSMTYTVTLTTPNGCIATDQAIVSLDPLSAEQICYVEFDTLTSKNCINWASNLSANIDSVYIYYEESTNIWNLIGSVSSNQSRFIDLNSTPFNQSFSYKISVKDTCGIETNKSSFHTTITLLSTFDQGTNTYGFTWSAYQGLSIANYYLYGIDTSGSEMLIGSTPGNQYFYNYVDPNPAFVKYFIGFTTPDCSGSKTDHLVKSNYVQSINTGLTKETGLNNLVLIFPNPVSDFLQIQTILQIKNIEIADIAGRILRTTTSKSVDCSDFVKGVYFINITTEKGRIQRKFVKE